ncbi:MAG: amidohydrolase family protein [Pseudorhodoplanes sp.]
MIIDWHANLWLPEHYADGGNQMVTRVGQSVDGGPQSFDEHIAGVCEKFVIVTMNFEPLGVAVPNEFVADYAKKYPGRAKALANVNPLDEKAPRQFEYAIKELGMHGLKMSPVYGAYDPWCEGARKLYKLCEQLNVPILWHQSAGYAAGCALEYGSPILLDRICREFPKLRMIIAHLGQPWMEECVVLLRKNPHIYSDLSARFHRKWQLYHGLMTALEYKVHKQLLFGSDFPLRTPKEAMEEFRAINDWGPGASMPKFPDEAIEDIINNRPIELLWPEG